MAKKPEKQVVAKKKLFIVEAPNKISTVKKYLGSDFVVMASVGHCFQLPHKDYVDIKNGFKLNYEIDPKKKQVLKDILEAAKECNPVYFAGDPDTEGSVIAWHLYQHLYAKYKDTKTYIRVNIKHMTKSGVEAGLAESYPITDPKEYAIAQSGFLRRIEDRFVGFRLSPLANIYVQQKTSAGRVQSPALRIVSEREKEILAFIPEVYYEIFADVFPKQTKDTFTAKYVGEVKDEKTAQAIVDQSKKGPVEIKKITRKQTKSNAPAPFDTMSLLSAASSILNWKTNKTTQIAQSLYASGKITYVRCDNNVISKEGLEMLIKYAKANFPKKYIPAKIPDYTNKKAKLEHECIRPTDLDAKPMLDADSEKLYNLIRDRFIAAGLEPAIYDNVSIDLKMKAHIYKATGSVRVFEGYLKVWDYTKKEDVVLPQIDEKTILEIRDIYSERKQTKPQPRFKGGSLVNTLKDMGIGTPATIDNILTVLEKREYIKYDKNSIVPTELGMRLNDFLTKYFLPIIDFDFTARVEADRDEVMLGKKKYEDAVGQFYEFLKEELKKSAVKISEDKKENETTTITCPTCQQYPLLKKLNRKDGVFFFSCAGYVDEVCKATYSIDGYGNPVKSINQQDVLKPCPGKGCKGSLVKRINKKTKQVFYACSDWKLGCKITADADGNINEKKEVKLLGKCPKCKKGSLIERKSRAGSAFIACTGWPKCKHTESLGK